jgi:hypothetical protein
MWLLVSPLQRPLNSAAFNTLVTSILNAICGTSASRLDLRLTALAAAQCSSAAASRSLNPFSAV